MEQEFLKAKEEDVMAAYATTDDEGKELLEKLFGKEAFRPKDVTERVKTLEDACRELGYNHPFVEQYQEVCNDFLDLEDEPNTADIVAYLQLRIICAALNEGWKPEFNEDETRYYPYFRRYIDTGHVVYRGYYWANAYGGVSVANTDNDASNADANVGSRLVFKTKELAEYAGKQFTDIWEDYLFGKEEEQ